MALLLNRNDGELFQKHCSPSSSPLPVRDIESPLECSISEVPKNSIGLSSTPTKLQSLISNSKNHLTPNLPELTPINSKEIVSSRVIRESAHLSSNFSNPSTCHAGIISPDMNASTKIIMAEPTPEEHNEHKFIPSRSSFDYQIQPSVVRTPDTFSSFLPVSQQIKRDLPIPGIYNPVIQPWHFALLAHHALAANSKCIV